MLSAYSLWGKDDPSMTISSGISLTAEESETYTRLMSDIITFAGEQVLSFILGNVELTEESWSEFDKSLETMGMSDCIQIY